MPGLFYPYGKLLCTPWRFCEWWVMFKRIRNLGPGKWMCKMESPRNQGTWLRHYFIYFICVYFQKDNGWLVLKPNQSTRVSYWPKWVFPCWASRWDLVTPPIPLWCTLAWNRERAEGRRRRVSLLMLWPHTLCSTYGGRSPPSLPLPQSEQLRFPITQPHFLGDPSLEP